jgi:hypothetical protein
MHTPQGQRQTLNSRLGRSPSARANRGGRTRERQRQRLGPDPIVTFGESHNTELNGDSLQLALKTEEGEISYLNEVSKAVDASYSTEAVQEHLERLDDLVTLRAHMMEQLVSFMRLKFRGDAESVCQFAISGQRSLNARSGTDWERSYNEFLVGRKGWSQVSEDDVVQIILGDQFQRRVVDGVMTPDENFEMVVLRWGRELTQAKLVLGKLFELIQPLSNELFKAKVRPDHRMCVIENRELIWTSQVATLLNLAIGDSALRQVPIGYG